MRLADSRMLDRRLQVFGDPLSFDVNADWQVEPYTRPHSTGTKEIPKA